MQHLKHLKRKQIVVLLSGLTMNTMATVAMAADDAGTQNTGGASVTSLTEVTVKSQRTSAVVTRAAQEAAPNLVNVTSAEEIRKLPDVNAGEALRRLPGISMSMGSGEGRFINIRGLDADLTSTTFGGVRLPPTNTATPFGGGRAIEMGVIPSGMIGSLTVTKTNKPEQDAEALGGTVEITPKSMPLNRDSFLEGKLGGGTETLRSTGVTDVSITGGIRFGGSGKTDSGLTSYSDKPFSFIGTYSRYEDSRGIDDLEAGYSIDGGKSPYPKAFSNLDQRLYNLHRTRYGAGGDLTFQPDAANKWFVRYYDFGYTEDINRNRLTYNFSGKPTLNADGSFTDPSVTFSKSLRDEHETMSTQLFTLGGENTLNWGKIDYRVAHTRGSDDRPYDYNSTFTNPNAASVTYNNIADPNHPRSTVTGINPFDPNGYTMSGFTNTPVLAKTSEWSTAANVAVPTHFSSAQDEEFKMGASARWRTNDYMVTPYTYGSSGVPHVPLSQVITGGPVTYYDGNYQNGYNIDSGAMRNLYAQGTGFVRNTAADALSAAAQATHNTENVFAVYGQEQMTFGKLGLLGGLRVENTDAHYYGNAISGNTVSQVAHAHNYSNVFPSLQARYELEPRSILRGSYSTTIARPGFNQTSAATTIDPSTNMVKTGNPDLQPTFSNNIDLSFEHYLQNGGIASLGVFNKALKDYIVSKIDFQTFPNGGAYTGLTPGTKVVSYDNISSASARGLEMNYEQHFTFLPGILSGLGAGFNWTYVDSKLEIRPGEFQMLPSTSRNTYNAMLFWQRNGLDLRLAANYMSRNLYAIGADKTKDVYAESRLSADFGASYQVAKQYGLYLSVKNLLNTPLRYSEGTPDRLIQRETYGLTVVAGATFSF